jgi:hypothetical protein
MKRLGGKDSGGLYAEFALPDNFTRGRWQDEMWFLEQIAKPIGVIQRMIRSHFLLTKGNDRLN